MSFAQDPDLDYNIRADSADVLLRLGSEDNKTTAREIIMILGRDGGTGRTIFDNTQNVNSRLEELMNKFDLKRNILYAGGSEVEISEQFINYEKVFLKLHEEINKSLAFLEKSLKV